ncbi:MAG: hypothetical protein J7578_18960 [Chitinophagaceae bacterium]|nr:hypothetical protein [Chitinophagaceae bacterium]
MLNIEFEEPTIEKCSCCGCDIIILTRFVYNENGAYAVYYAKFEKGHGNKIVNGLISLGNWYEGSEPEHRVAFPFRIWLKENDFQIGLTDREESPWAEVAYLGRILDREDALQHPWLAEVFHITDHIVANDKPVVEYFS